MLSNELNYEKVVVNEGSQDIISAVLGELTIMINHMVNYFTSKKFNIKKVNNFYIIQ